MAKMPNAPVNLTWQNPSVVYCFHGSDKTKVSRELLEKVELPSSGYLRQLKELKMPVSQTQSGRVWQLDN